MANPSPKTTLLTEAYAYGLTQTETPYDKLLEAATADGWAVRLSQRGEPLPHAQGILINFDVLLGKGDAAPERVETISINVTPTMGPVSLAGRIQARESLIYLFFGRLPPEAERPAAAAAQPTHAPVVDERLYDAPPPVDVVADRTPDGLPIFVDLYGVALAGPVVADLVLDVIEKVLPTITTVPALGALYTSNTGLVEFFKDLARPEQRQDLKAMMDRRKAEIEDAGAVAPRRRQQPLAN